MFVNHEVASTHVWHLVADSATGIKIARLQGCLAALLANNSCLALANNSCLSTTNVVSWPTIHLCRQQTLSIPNNQHCQLAKNSSLSTTTNIVYTQQ